MTTSQIETRLQSVEAELALSKEKFEEISYDAALGKSEAAKALPAIRAEQEKLEAEIASLQAAARKAREHQSRQSVAEEAARRQRALAGFKKAITLREMAAAKLVEAFQILGDAHSELIEANAAALQHAAGVSNLLRADEISEISEKIRSPNALRAGIGYSLARAKIINFRHPEEIFGAQNSGFDLVTCLRQNQVDATTVLENALARAQGEESK